MASLERTAYPRFKRLISERELREFFTPSAEEVAWAHERTHDRPGRVLALLVMLKSAARLARVPKIGEIPEAVVAHVQDQAGLAAGTVPQADSERSEERYRTAVRERLELRHRPGEARVVAEAAMRAAAPVKAHTADLVNVALEELVRQESGWSCRRFPPRRTWRSGCDLGAVQVRLASTWRPERGHGLKQSVSLVPGATRRHAVPPCERSRYSDAAVPNE
ncbi:DUF4158 domain-containing protein [Streptomyces sp. NPDC093094]|uniref:DUF4158 domain-containing protein n=1 Tax=Streptomyces sp. NPDC093094 TaxID=3366026 RepID=UPI00380564EE